MSKNIKITRTDNGEVTYLKSTDRWYASVMHGYNDDGKPNRISFYGKTKEIAKEKLKAFLESPESLKKYSSKKEMLVCDFFEHWFKDYKYQK